MRKTYLATVDQERGGAISTRIRELREAGKSFDDIAQALRSEDIDTNREDTRRYWMKLQEKELTP